MSAPPQLSLVIPAFNEVATIQRTLRAIRDYLAPRGTTYELIVAADGADGTREAAAALARELPVRVMGAPERRGKGRGVREGVLAATGEIVGFLDADYKVTIEEIEKVLPWLDRDYDIVIGSRAAAGADIRVRQPWYRRIGSKGFALVMRPLIGLHGIGDTQCGFKFFRAEVARDLFSRQRIDGYMFDVEILSLAVRAGYRIKEVGVAWQDDGDTRLKLVSGNWKNFKDLFRIRFGGRRAPAVAVPRV
ncbi:glycosyl transferase : Glycosyl transferase, family 2 OS=Solibacter usitatus (strain Ellin6076) GN=Acid_0575 PE=4 SV=1: Glycos_transf_2 [Gemmata massiliana]|uniref:dolichyl-phosphate beta-glucosyltransferase n=1 Tax=Gemmata massiliana TaxID=1210884 RepID=A0A6P2CWG9_9BACT|nr:dolichyl-phosphate beta-glucosyltransferase [Gemmata massiliana]VTR92736.1 glycosyl transferase : Glycosyl transferase, family 2 OS=Solibacter usitatus (strain Ellin6076) GN=Acid_0575 PE=4 SV=1: Glycos_transf_2 [Gemmata massiliana]